MLTLLGIGIDQSQSLLTSPQSPVVPMQSEVNSQTAEFFCETGNQLKTQGRLNEAIANYQKALSIRSDYAEVHDRLGEIYFAQRNFTEAIASCNNALKLQPDFAPAYKTLGNVLQAQGKIEEAIRAYSKALEINPEFAEAYVNKGSMLSKQGQHEEAIACLEKAIALKPNMAAAYWNLATVFMQLDRLKESIACRQKAFELKPELASAEALNDLGTAVGKLGNLEEAIAYYKKAIELLPNYPMAHLNLGTALKQQGQLEEAKKHLGRAIELKPEYAEAHSALASIYAEEGNLYQALFEYEKVLLTSQNSAEAHFNVGTVLARQDKFEGAIAKFQKAIELLPDFAEAYCNIGMVMYQQTKKKGEISGEQFNLAINSLLKALEINPEMIVAHLYLSQLINCPGRNSDFALIREAAGKYQEKCGQDNQIIAASTFISTHVRSGLHQLAKEKFLEIEPQIYQSLEKLNSAEVTILYSHILFNLHYLRDDLEANTKLYKAVAQQYVKKVIDAKKLEIPKAGKRNRQTEPLKIGLMSSHFVRHSVGWCSADIISELSKITPNLYLYFTGDREADERTKVFEKAAAKFFRTNTLKSGDDIKEIVEYISQDELDILIDLDSLTITSQVEILYHQPATVCLSWLGFEAPFTNPNNYLLCDWHTHPAGREQYNCEKLVRMPNSFVAVGGFESNNIDREAARKAKRIAEDQVIYLCVAPAYKLNPELIQAQVKIIKQVPDSVLIYKGHTGDFSVIESAYKQECQAQKVGSHRIKFLPRTETEEEHRKVYQIADILLDSYPYNGGTHTLEALWFNLPVVTRCGEQYLSRMGYSFMQTLSLSTGVANSWEEYVKWGIELGKNADLRKAAREQLVQSKQPETLSPLWNPKKLAQDMYAVLEQLLSNG